MSDPGPLPASPPVSPPAFWDGDRRGGISWTRRPGPLGWVFLILAVAGAGLLLLAFSYPAPPFPLAFAAGAVAVLLAGWALLAVLRALSARGRPPALSGLTVAAAIAIAVVTTVVCAVRLPLLVRFHGARPELTALATTALSRPAGDSTLPCADGRTARAGTFAVSTCQAVGGRVYFTVGSTGPFGRDNVYVVYSPVGTPTVVAGLTHADARHLTGPWWTAVDSTTSWAPFGGWR